MTHTLDVSEVELARGRRMMKQSLREIRQASPGAVMERDFHPIPVAFMTVIAANSRVPVPLLVDPLQLLRRSGVEIQRPELGLTPDPKSDWMEI